MKKLLIFLIILLLATGCTIKDNENTITLFYMDTYITVKIYDDDKSVLEEVEAIYKKYHQLSDRYESYDGIININYLNNSEGEFVLVDPILYNLIEYGIEVNDISLGKVNIALGNVTYVWHTYRENLSGIPTFDELNLNHDIEDIILKDGKVKLNNNIQIDLGALAKGYATEKVGNYLESKGITKYLINAGGNVKVGDHYNSGKYKVGIENPLIANDIYTIAEVNNKSVVTSGGYLRFYEYDGKRYHHIIDPVTLFPTEYMKSVTVICEDSSLGDALSTTLFLMPVNEGLDFINNMPDVEAVWYVGENDIRYSMGFDSYEKK